jgi:hypothetical protein
LGGQPQPVLAELVGGAFGHRDDGHRMPGLGLERVELLAQDLLVAAYRAVHDGQVFGDGARGHGGQTGQRRGQSEK